MFGLNNGLTQISSSRKHTVVSTATNGNYFFFGVIWKSHTHKHTFANIKQSRVCVCLRERERETHSHFSCWHMWMPSSSCSFTKRMNDIPIELIRHCVCKNGNDNKWFVERQTTGVLWQQFMSYCKTKTTQIKMQVAPFLSLSLFLLYIYFEYSFFSRFPSSI